MNQTTDKPKRVHHGRNVKRIREFQGIKQDAFAELLGKDWNQQKVSDVEKKEIIEPELIKQLASALNVPEESIENLTNEMATNIFTNHFHDGSSGGNLIQNGPVNFNPLDKVMELVGKNEALHEQVKVLYEQLLKVEREKNALLEKLLNQR